MRTNYSQIRELPDKKRRVEPSELIVESIDRHRTGKEVALGNITSGISQVLKDCGAFSSFAYDAKAQDVPKVNNGANNCGVPRIVPHIRNEALINLKFCSGQRGQVAERGLRDTKIVDAQTSACEVELLECLRCQVRLSD